MSTGLLFVENGDYFQEVLRSRLCREEYKFFCARQPVDAKKIISRDPVDVGLVDLSGLKVEGIRIIREIKRLKPHVEIITINTYDQIVHSIEAMKAGAFDDFLVPVEINALIGRIKAAGQHKQEAEKQRRPLLKRCQDAMMAVAFAEAGELETARVIAENGILSDEIKEIKNGQR